MTQIQNSAHKMKMSTVPFVGDILPEAGAMVVSEHDGHIYYADKYGWHKADAVYSPITLFVDFNGVTQFNFRFKAPSTSTLNIDEGDGTVTEVAGQDNTLVTHATTYTEAGKYTFTVSEGAADITEFRVVNANYVAYNASALALCPNLTAITINTAAKIYGDVGLWAGLTSLTTISGVKANLFGDASRLVGLTSLTNIYITSAYVTFESDSPWSLTGATCIACGINHNSETVDRMIRAYKGVTDCRINMMRSSPRTKASDPDLLTLLQNGNFIILSEAHEIGGLGPELHTGPNAASDPNGNEANAVTGWTPSLLTTPNIFKSQNLDKAKGVWAIKADSNPNPTDGASFTQAFPCSVDDIIRVSFKWHHIGLGGEWTLIYDGALLANTFIQNTDIDYMNSTFYYIATDTSFDLGFGEHYALSGGLYLDNLSARVLTP